MHETGPHFEFLTPLILSIVDLVTNLNIPWLLNVNVLKIAPISSSDRLDSQERAEHRYLTYGTNLVEPLRYPHVPITYKTHRTLDGIFEELRGQKHERHHVGVRSLSQTTRRYLLALPLTKPDFGELKSLWVRLAKPETIFRMILELLNDSGDHYKAKY